MHAEISYRGDAAQVIKAGLAAVPDASRDTALREFWKQTYAFIDPAKVAATFDPATGIERLSIDGTATLKWDDDFYRVPGGGLAFEADFARPPGPNADAPFATDHPAFSRSITTLTLPPGVILWPGEVGHNVDQTLAGVAYHREAVVRDNVLRMTKTERSIAPEIPATEARAAQARLRAINDEDVYLKKDRYRASDSDLAALMASTPDTAGDRFERGLLLLDRNRLKEAIADFNKVHELEPRNAYALANRGIAFFWSGERDKAEADLSAAQAIAPSNSVASRGRALLASASGDFARAIEHYSASLAVDPSNVFALKQRVALHRQRHFIRRHSASVVADFDPVEPPVGH